MDRGLSRTVREGSAIPWPESEPSLTVGLRPRPDNTTLEHYPSRGAACGYNGPMLTMSGLTA